MGLARTPIFSGKHNIPLVVPEDYLILEKIRELEDEILEYMKENIPKYKGGKSGSTFYHICEKYLHLPFIMHKKQPKE